MTIRSKRFLSSLATRAEDGSVVLTFFDGPGRAVAILKGSVDATLNLISNCAASLQRDNNSRPENE